MGFLNCNNYIISRVRDIINGKRHNQKTHTIQVPVVGCPFQFDLEGNR